MPIIGGRQASVRGLGFQGAGKPSAPTINSVSVVNSTTVTINYTLGSSNGAPITTIGITSSPSLALTFTNTDLDGSVNVTGSFVLNQAYTFTMTATNAVGTSDASSASSAVTPNAFYYSLSFVQNFLNGIDTRAGVMDSQKRSVIASTFESNYHIIRFNNDATRSVDARRLVQEGSVGEFVRDVCVDQNDNIYVCGMRNNGGAMNASIFSLNGSTFAINWQKAFASNNSDIQFSGVAADSLSNGHIYAAGYYVASGGRYDSFIVKYSKSDGSIAWQKIFQNTSQGQSVLFNDIALDSSGNPHAVGYMANDVIIAKYDTSGNLTWQRRLGDSGGSSTDRGQAIAVDSSGNVCIVGSTEPSGSNSGILVAKYNSSGTLQWQNKIDAPVYNDSGYGVGVDADGNVYVGGESNLNGLNDWVLAKFNSGGTVQWRRTLGSGKQERVSTIFTDSQGNITVAGSTADSNNTTQGLCAILPGDGSKTGVYSVGPNNYSYTSSTIATSTASLTSETPTVSSVNGGLSNDNTSLSSSANTSVTASTVIL